MWSYCKTAASTHNSLSNVNLLIDISITYYCSSTCPSLLATSILTVSGMHLLTFQVIFNIVSLQIIARLAWFPGPSQACHKSCDKSCIGRSRLLEVINPRTQNRKTWLKNCWPFSLTTSNQIASFPIKSFLPLGFDTYSKGTFLPAIAVCK